MDVHPTKNGINRYWPIPNKEPINLFFHRGEQLPPTSPLFCDLNWEGTEEENHHAQQEHHILCTKVVPVSWWFWSLKVSIVDTYALSTKKHNWLVVSIPLKNISLLGWWHSQYMESRKIQVPNHQPDKGKSISEIILIVYTSHGSDHRKLGKLGPRQVNRFLGFSSQKSAKLPMKMRETSWILPLHLIGA